MMSSCRKPLFIFVVLVALGVGCVQALAQQGEFDLGKASISLSDAERAWLAEHKDLRLGVWLGAPPTMFRGDSGTMQGMVPAYMDIIIRKLGLTPRRVRASSFAALWELAKAGEVDVVAALSAEPERTESMLLSEPYLYMPIVIVTRSDFPFISGLKDLSGRIVAMDAGQVPHLRIPEEYDYITPLPVDSPEHGLLAVSSGQVDAYVGDQATVAYLSRMHGITNVRIAAITEYSYRLSVGVRKDWPILLTLINRVLASITEEERKGIQDYWTVLRDGDWVHRPQMWRMVGGVLFVALALVGLIAFWNRKLAREVRLRRRAETKFRRAHEATQQIIESADVIIVGLDYAGHVRLLNNAGEVATGYKREQLLGKNWFDIVVPKERYPYAWDEFVRLVNEGSRSVSDTFENPILTMSGETRHIQWRNSVTSKDNADMAVISFGTDITSRLQAEEELRLTQFAMDNAAVGVFRIRPSGDIVYANRTAANLLGYTRSELKRMSIPEISPDFSHESWPVFWERLKYNQMMTTEKSVYRKDGKTIPVEVTAYYLLFKGTELVIGFFSDISERKRVEMLRDDVERMVRHDLRSPTIAVQTLFKLFAKADNLTETQREILESVMSSTRRMINIIDMSRALYLMEAGTYAVKPVPIDMLRLVQSAIGDLHPLLRIKKINVAVCLDGAPASSNNVFFIESEELLCYALLSNLLKNAVEASPDGESVTLDFSRLESHVISVHNHGVIPEDIRENFFEKYVTAGKEQGTGLGTYTSHLIVRTLGGKIDFSTSRSEGTVITVELPL